MRRRDFFKTGAAFALAAQPRPVRLENAHFSLAIDEATGAPVSLLVKRNGSELIGERRLAANFRIGLPLTDYLCHYLEGMNQKPAGIERTDDSVTVHFRGMSSEKGYYDLDLSYTVRLAGDEVHFRARLANRTAHPVAEFWFPRIGGWTGFGGRDALAATPTYATSCRHSVSLFRKFPGTRGFGAEAAEWTRDYPGMTMPWWDVFDARTGTGLYLGYHDRTFRFSTWHCYLYPDASGAPGDAWVPAADAGGEPVGLVFSHVRYPFIQSGEVFDTGDFILAVHPGDWHTGSRLYRKWFLENFPFDKSGSWLRKQSAWFTSIIYQPEDRVIADYKTYDQWCRDAESFGINCHELIGWDKGGLERDYPEYFPEPKLGGWEGYRALLASIRSRGKRCLTFVNYNVLDSAGDEYPKLKPYTHQDQFGHTPNWMAWGESTLIARKALSVHRHVRASVVPGLQKVLEDRFLKLVEAGADGFQIDKVVVGSTLDFNPLNRRKPDEALCEGLVEAIAGLLEKARRINPEFCLASEAVQDRLLPYVDVFYRASSGHGIAPLRYVFPEWTSAQHVSMPRDFRSVNGAVMTGSVICVEPRLYQGTLADPLYRDLARYIQEVERIRHELADTIFLGDYFDTEGAVLSAPDGVFYAVHGNRRTGRRAIVVVNESEAPRRYTWRFTHRGVARAALYAPFAKVQEVAAEAAVSIRAAGLHVLVESR